MVHENASRAIDAGVGVSAAGVPSQQDPDKARRDRRSRPSAACTPGLRSPGYRMGATNGPSCGTASMTPRARWRWATLKACQWSPLIEKYTRRG